MNEVTELKLSRHPISDLSPFCLKSVYIRMDPSLRSGFQKVSGYERTAG